MSQRSDYNVLSSVFNHMRNLMGELAEGASDDKPEDFAEVSEEVERACTQNQDLRAKVAKMDEEARQMRVTIETLHQEAKDAERVVDAVRAENNRLKGQVQTYQEAAAHGAEGHEQKRRKEPRGKARRDAKETAQG